MNRGLALVALWALAACAKTVTPGSTPSAGGPIGYVRMDDVIKHHPLYPQLAQYDQNIDALTLGGTVPHALAGADVKKQQAQIAKELQDAANRTKALLDQKQKQYQDREAQAIQQALKSSGVSAPGAGAVASQVSQTAGVQSADASRAAQRDFASYQHSLAAQNENELSAMQHTITDRANRTYRAEQDELQAKEAALTLDLANKDAAERLALKTKLSSLALDDAARQDARTKLDALDRSEADQVGAMRNRDSQTLAALQTRLRAQVQADMKAQAATINARALAKLQSRESDLRRQFAAPAMQSTTITGGSGVAASARAQNLPPALRDRIAHLHADYQKQFTADAQATIDDFQKTRLDLSRRYAALGGADAAAGSDARDQIASLQHKRDELYEQMVEQIKREATTMAHQRGLSVVVSNPVAEIRGVDLTDDVAKDVETLHE